ncbi:MAG: hypothetical protein NUV56_01500 [Candidatus Uhrbacteria bacterium]|nr:hypothetical protein [Candidatus Uhrbacteria bacterium]
MGEIMSFYVCSSLLIMILALSMSMCVALLYVKDEKVRHRTIISLAILCCLQAASTLPLLFEAQAWRELAMLSETEANNSYVIIKNDRLYVKSAQSDAWYAFIWNPTTGRAVDYIGTE